MARCSRPLNLRVTIFFLSLSNMTIAGLCEFTLSRRQKKTPAPWEGGPDFVSFLGPSPLSEGLHRGVETRLLGGCCFRETPSLDGSYSVEAKYSLLRRLVNNNRSSIIESIIEAYFIARPGRCRGKAVSRRWPGHEIAGENGGGPGRISGWRHWSSEDSDVAEFEGA